MKLDLLGDLDWLAVIAAAVAYFIVGAIWYAPPLFGRMWMAAGGLSDVQQEGGPGPAIFLVPAIGSVLSAIALGLLALASATDTVGEGIVLGLVVGTGFAIAISMVTAAFESTKPRPMVWGAVNAGYHLVGSVVAAIVIAAIQ